MLLVKFNCDYADEFDVEGFSVYTEEEWSEVVQGVKEGFENQTTSKEREVYFGTNEACTFENFDQWLNCFRVYTITDDEAAFVNRVFPYGFGDFLIPYFED